MWAARIPRIRRVCGEGKAYVSLISACKWCIWNKEDGRQAQDALLGRRSAWAEVPGPSCRFSSSRARQDGALGGSLRPRPSPYKGLLNSRVAGRGSQKGDHVHLVFRTLGTRTSFCGVCMHRPRADAPVYQNGAQSLPGGLVRVSSK